MGIEEIEYFRHGDMLVSSTRIEINGQTFAVRNVGSVKVTQPGTPVIALLMAFLGLIFVLSKDTKVFGAIVLGLSGWVIYQKLRTRTLVLVSGGGETSALTTTDQALVQQLRDAIATAISAR